MQIIMKETMRGWIELNETHEREIFDFSIQIGLMKGSHLLSAKPFKGTIRLNNRNYSTRVEGEVTFQMTGPRYEFDFEHPDAGLVRVAGEKSFALSDLKESIAACPLTVYSKGQAIGYVEIRYIDPIYKLPFKSFGIEANSDNALFS